MILTGAMSPCDVTGAITVYVYNSYNTPDFLSEQICTEPHLLRSTTVVYKIKQDFSVVISRLPIVANCIAATLFSVTVSVTVVVFQLQLQLF